MGQGLKALAVAFAKTAFNIRFTVITIAAMMALGYITRYCGLDATLGWLLPAPARSIPSSAP